MMPNERQEHGASCSMIIVLGLVTETTLGQGGFYPELRRKYNGGN